MTSSALPPKRPLSPHLQIYRRQLTSVMSIMHRITGIGLTLGALLLVAWLWSAAYSPACFVHWHHFFASIFGKLLLVGWVFAFYYHLFNGIRHLFWDMGRDLEIHIVYRTGWIAIAATALMTAVIFFADMVGNV